MSGMRKDLAGMVPDVAAAHVMDNDISELLDNAHVVRERRPRPSRDNGRRVR